ncbi:MAG: tRNA pseudouridine(38-40) synthase TruA [Phycisphaerae bacterium]|nr:tRNA pseudouridine(38-40) synthase TruA [Phycisphaerae bacterium]
MATRNIKLMIAYDGTDYHGWQRQPNMVTVQQVMEEAMEGLFQQPVKLKCSGRTDAGVHAQGQVANFKVDTPIPCRRMHMVLNRYLPGDIRIWRAEDVADDFDANYCAISKMYRYTVYNRDIRDMARTIPTQLRFAYDCPVIRDVQAMRIAAQSFVGEHDFKSFAASTCDKKTTIRRVLRCQVYREGVFVHFDVEGTGFLHNMVRNMVGYMMDVGYHKRDPYGVHAAMAAKDRSAAGTRAPANGLCLQWVRYP